MTPPGYRADPRISRVVTRTRPIIGLASGLTAHLFVLADIIPFGGRMVAAAPLAVAFGFSERLFS
jgi:hypothetical protein